MADRIPSDDNELVALILEGRTELFSDLVRRYQQRLYRYLSRYTADTEEARDITQEVFFKVYGALDTFDPRYRFSTWLFRIAANAAIDSLRRKRLKQVPLEQGPGEDGDQNPIDPADGRPDPYEDLSRRRLRLLVDQAIERLPDDYRELLSLRHYGELPYEEIAEIKKMPLGTVKNKLFRARQALRDLLPKDIV
ncbi:MAG: sigma-70 family RNA polymerase sigma factor [Thermoanaerobaculia bacterium]|nr:ECF RNA polymerase sigma factor SigW [Thermoanaerobaculia bacterium]MCK6682409.1 sigma-70 family RNA polymerase sigma factor [Thermoanaerobaculia bacterium]